MDRALGEVPNVAKAYWDWRNQIGWVRFEKGKMADVVLWSGDPFSVYSRAEKVWVDGALLYDRQDPERQPGMDFTVGIVADQEAGS